MNTPATLVPNAQTNDLVLRFIGGKNDGESVSISTKNCTLGGNRQTENNESVRDQCAIYRGPAGVTLKSHGDEVLINGEAKSVHWLEQGDRIQFSDSQAVEVVQLGHLESAKETYEVNTETVTETAEVAGERIDFVSDAVQDQLADETSSFAAPTAFQSGDSQFAEPAMLAEPVLEVPDESVAEEPVSAPVGDSGQVDEGVTQRFESLENSVNQLNDSAANVDRRFDRLEDSLNALTEHLERLAAGSMSNASVESTTAAISSDASAVQPIQDVTDTLTPEAAVESVVSAAPEIVEVPAAPVEDSANLSAGDNYEKSIAALFSELGSTDTPEAPVDQAAMQPAAETTPSEDYVSQTNESVDSALSSIPTANEPNATEQPAVGFTERMLASMHDETPTLSSEEVASVVGLGIAKPETPVEVAPAAEATPDVEETAKPVLREEARTESVADIFARLHSGASATEGADAAPSPAAPIRQPVQTTFEDIQASISAALDADVLPTSEAPADLGDNDQVVAAEILPDEPVAAEAVDSEAVDSEAVDSEAVDSEAVDSEAVGPEAVDSEAVGSEAVGSDEPAEDVSSVMEKFRAGLAAEEAGETEEAGEITEESGDADADGGQQQDSVDDYMSMLMNRMNGDSESLDDSVTTTVPELSDVNNPSQSGLLDKEAIQTLLTEEEFVPKQKRVPIKSLDKMRELANSTSRSAVQRSEKAIQIERKKSMILQTLALVSLGLAVLMIWLKSYIFGGAFTVIFFVVSAYFFYDTVSPSRSKEAAPVKKMAQKRPEPEPTPETDGN